MPGGRRASGEGSSGESPPQTNGLLGVPEPTPHTVPTTLAQVGDHGRRTPIGRSTKRCGQQGTGPDPLRSPAICSPHVTHPSQQPQTAGGQAGTGEQESGERGQKSRESSTSTPPGTSALGRTPTGANPNREKNPKAAVLSENTTLHR